MKKKLIIFLFLCAAVCLCAGCKKKVNYFDYISEQRYNVYLYADDDVEIKIYCSVKEQPYAADGYKGDTSGLIEIFVSLPKNPEELEVSFNGHGGEMNYQAVDNCYYLSFTADDFTGDSADVTLTYGGESKTYKTLSVRDAGVMSCENAVKCVIEHDRALFDGLTNNGLFDGEIFVRLLYDDGCYYYVGICDKNKNVTAYLIDGTRGKVIATKQMQG